MTCLITLILTMSASFAQARSQRTLTTIAEESGWKRTGRYEEVLRLCPAFERRYPGRARCEQFGQTPEGRPMVALVAGAELRPGRGVPVVLVQGGIHAGEIDGKDAGFKVLRDILDGDTLPGVLRKVTVVFVPVFNVDGFERFGPHNRPNQIGPEETGWRVTGQNLNLNRDYLKADSPEMAALLGLLRAWDPVLYVDTHVTDGADFQHDVSLVIDPSLEGPAQLTLAGARLRDAMMTELKSKGHLPFWIYPSFHTEDDPTSGFEVFISPPRFSEAYWALRNRIGVLVETHSWKDYATRIRATEDTIIGLLAAAAKDGRDWLVAAAEADLEAASLAGRRVPLKFEPTEKTRPIEFHGYSFRKFDSEISGQKQIVYDPGKPEVWSLPLRYELKPTLLVEVVRGGYVVPAAFAARVEEKLRLHGLKFETLKAAVPRAEVEVFRATATEFAKGSYEGRQTLDLKGEWRQEKRAIPAGSLYVPIAQPLSRLVLHLMEPLAPDSLARWGHFNACFERREYMEAYVAEQVAREMLARDPAVKAEFERKLQEEPEFAKDPAKRLEFFYRRHPSWDERFNLYPIYRWARP